MDTPLLESLVLGVGSLLLVLFVRVTQLEDGMGDAGKGQGARAEVGASHWGLLIPQLCAGD